MNHLRNIRIYIRSFLVVTIYLTSITPASAQKDSLYHYLEIAAKNNPAILQRFREYEAALQKIPQVGSLSDPELSAGVFLTPMELMDGKQIADFRLMQMFPWFGVLRYAKDEMSLMANAKFELFRDTKLQVLYDAQRTWYQLFKIQKEMSISEKNIEILKMIERLTIVKYTSSSSSSSGSNSTNSQTNQGSASLNSGSSGMQTMSNTRSNASGGNQATGMNQGDQMSSSSSAASLSDVYRIQIESGDLENNIALLKNQQNSIMAQFNSFLNRPLSSPVNTEGSPSGDSLTIYMESVPDSILMHNPMLVMLDYERRSLEARKKMVTRMGYPMLGLGLNYSIIGKTSIPMGELSMNGKDMVMPMLVITLPIYRKKYVAMQNEAELMKEASSESYQSTANSLKSEYYQAVSMYEDARRRVKLYEKQSQLASKSFDLILKSYSSTSSVLTDVLRARQLTLEYELKKTEAVSDYYTAVAWLKRLMANPQIK